LDGGERCASRIGLIQLRVWPRIPIVDWACGRWSLQTSILGQLLRLMWALRSF